ncbi:hypothetical protein KAU19_00345 [Candidatus Parcubacteria bacterium]|nr:hypothetical protein [Candidatus Parcubacteria bacterium]
MVIKLLGLSQNELVDKGKFFVFSFDEDDFVITTDKEKMKKYLLEEERIDPDDIEDDDHFDPDSDQDVLLFNPHWGYKEDVTYDKLLDMFGGIEEINEAVKEGLKDEYDY